MKNDDVHSRTNETPLCLFSCPSSIPSPLLQMNTFSPNVSPFLDHPFTCCLDEARESDYMLELVDCLAHAPFLPPHDWQYSKELERGGGVLSQEDHSSSSSCSSQQVVVAPNDYDAKKASILTEQEKEEVSPRALSVHSSSPHAALRVFTPTWLQHASLLEHIRQHPLQHVRDLEHSHLSRLLTYIHNKEKAFTCLKFDIFSAPNAQHREKINKAMSAVYLVSGKLFFPKKEYIRFSLKAIMDALSQKELTRRNSIWILVKNQFYFTTCEAKRANFPNCDNMLELNPDDTVSLRKEDSLNGFSSKVVSPTSAVFKFKHSSFQRYHPSLLLPSHPIEKTVLICKRLAKPTSHPTKKRKEHDIWFVLDKTSSLDMHAADFDEIPKDI
ncbi:hypothetical protein FDP41_006094 [Naegleria fowleri]|uniref:Uncharacterized protein n=1 Tax=Naegleria fowleri TaxID=5763 RepID=A0A6A5BKT9_NAEFO|nr:uncharacterized protein FDP41_006094 [Naegleria fowleri]KAF0974620.1 hypothetical protein FDP41_006094 [Naegleria fowleri]